MPPIKRLILALGATLAIAVMVGMGVLAVRATQFLNSPMALPADGALFEIASGSNFASISSALAERGYIEHPDWFRWYARLSDRASAVQAGEYRIDAGTTPEELLEMFVSGEVELYSFTIVEGWTYRELVRALAVDENIEKTIEFEDWPALIESLASEFDHPEGLFLPETYRFPKGTRDTDLLAQAYGLMQETLAAEWRGRAENSQLANPYEALILASIVEKETALATERPQIAGVFTRRLEKNMRLQTDPTVIYGIGEEFDGNLTRRHLREDTPYNTYTRGGLPPTPIALPGQAAINAALHPEPGTSLYFVATGLGDGSHKFSDTKAEHDQAVQEYLRRQRMRRDNAGGQ